MNFIKIGNAIVNVELIKAVQEMPGKDGSTELLITLRSSYNDWVTVKDGPPLDKLMKKLNSHCRRPKKTHD